MPDPGGVRSSVSATAWPGVPDGAGAALLALQRQLDQTQWLPPGELAIRQRRQLSLVLRHAAETVPFHRERLAAAGYAPGDDLSAEGFRRLPRMTRRDIQEGGAALRSTGVPAAHGKVVRGETSGSTGAPIRYFGTGLTRLFWHACTLRDHLWHGRDASARLAVIRKNMRTARLAGWGPPVGLVFRTGPCSTLDIGADIDSQLDWLQREQPAYLITNAHNLYWLARRSIERGIGLAGLRQARCFGGTFPEDGRAAVRAAWGVSLADIYTAEEVGYIALQCPEHDHYHVQAENVIVEILDERGEPCAPGAVGRVVLSTLHNYAMPLIRYEIGDYAEAGAPCPCGRGLPVIARILGRQRNMLTLPDGRRRWPSFPSAKWSHAAPVRQLQLVQRDPARIEVRVVPERALSERERAGLAAALQGCLGHPFAMEVREVAEIPRGADHKFEDFISEIAG